MSERMKIAKKMSLVSIIGNIFLSAIKIIIGFVGNSSAMIADGIHSVSDVFTSVIAYFGVYISDRKDDEDHQYGHEKLELVISKILAIVLLVTGLYIAYGAIIKISNQSYQIPTRIAIAGAVISIISKEAMYRYTLVGALKIDSNALKADAWHHRTDALSSIGALIGIVGAMNGYPVLDPVASIVIAGLIIKVAVDIYVDSVKGLIDTVAPKEIVDEIRSIALNVEGVQRIDLLKSRQHSNKIYCDIEISADPNLTLENSHKIAEEVHDQIEDQIDKIKHCMVHVNPYEGDQDA